jgi:hypothetical protein
MSDEPEWSFPDLAELMATCEGGGHVPIRFVDGVWYRVHTCHTAETIERLEYYDRLRASFADMAEPPKLTFEHPLFRGSGIA